MLFNSFPFLFAFLPAVLGLHWLVERFRPEWRVAALVLMSLAFYGYWDWRFVPLLLASIGLNWLVAEAFQRRPRPVLIGAAITGNLALLGLFKYAAFTAGLLDLLPGIDLVQPSIALPLGISFFTFHHVMYLSDLRAGRAPRYGLVEYAFYIAFFPQVLAGPLVRWSEVMHQLGERPYARPDAAERFARGLMLFVVGLAKKVFVGDPLAGYVNPVYAAAAAGSAITTGQAWQATLGFTFQIYFDFSGYTDMALGLALLFGIVLPQNFDAPYRSASLSDFWRRWHMTLSRFLRDYLYVPLGGNRRGLPVQLWALLATMALGGLWHGAGLTFVAWGLLHGLGLCVALLWRRAGLPMPAPVGWALTFGFVTLTWVLFRAPTFEAATRIYTALLGFNDWSGPFKWRTVALAAALALLGPTAWAAVHRLPPRRSVAVAIAAVLVLALFKLGDDASYEFIYFQF
jgi:alginate O-acetyltransferase complex protein AlgI